MTNLKAGDYVFPAISAAGTWRTHGVHDSAKLFPFPRKDLSITTLATLLVNPPTAYLLLKNFVELKKGDVIVQNGANSAVGKYVIQVRTIHELRARCAARASVRCRYQRLGPRGMDNRLAKVCK